MCRYFFAAEALAAKSAATNMICHDNPVRFTCHPACDTAESPSVHYQTYSRGLTSLAFSFSKGGLGESRGNANPSCSVK